MEELLKQVSQDLQNLAMPRTYDWLILAVSFTSIILSFIIFRRQTKISEKQTEIMKQQNKIALYELKYETYKELSKMLSLNKYLKIETSPQPNIELKNYIVNCVIEALHKDSLSLPNKDELFFHYYKIFLNKRDVVDRGKFLFDMQLSEEINTINNHLNQIIPPVIIYGELPQKENLVIIDNFIIKTLPMIEAELKL